MATRTLDNRLTVVAPVSAFGVKVFGVWPLFLFAFKEKGFWHMVHPPSLVGSGRTRGRKSHARDPRTHAHKHASTHTHTHTSDRWSCEVEVSPGVRNALPCCMRTCRKRGQSARRGGSSLGCRQTTDRGLRRDRAHQRRSAGGAEGLGGPMRATEGSDAAVRPNSISTARPVLAGGVRGRDGGLFGHQRGELCTYAHDFATAYGKGLLRLRSGGQSRRSWDGLDLRQRGQRPECPDVLHRPGRVREV